MDTERPDSPTTPAAIPVSQPGAPKLNHPGATNATAPPVSKIIQQSKPGLGSPIGAAPAPAVGRSSGAALEEPIRPITRLPDTARPLPVAESGNPLAGGKITAFGKERRHEDRWSRTPNTTGHGAIHVKTFHCKLTEDAIAYMDQAVNEWLDAHPQYEVKFVSSTVGTLTGKLKEPALFCQVWV
jgi:hypothetical protein